MSLNLDGLTDAQLRAFAAELADRAARFFARNEVQRAEERAEKSPRGLRGAELDAALNRLWEDSWDGERAEQQRILDEIRKEAQP